MPASGKKTKAGAAKAGTSKRSASKRAKSDRELLDTPRGGKRYIRREAGGEFAENQDSVSRSLRQDVKKQAKKTVPVVKATAATRKGVRPRRSGRVVVDSASGVG